MATFTTLLIVYVLGGITFLPLVIISIFVAGLYTFPYRDDLTDALEETKDDLIQPGDDVTALEAALKAEKGLKDGSQEKEKTRLQQDGGDEAAGYFAVCREYTPMGINAKPIERTSPAGSTTVAAPSQSIYQTMYRGIFERKQAPSPIDNNSPVSQRAKKAGNVYYVILRHGHLMLFDDEDQTEVRYVISLLLHDISIYSGDESIPEGELFIKRNAICLSQRQVDQTAQASQEGPDVQVSRPFYLFSENCSAKEDFYISLLKNQDQVIGAEIPSPRPLLFETKSIIGLVQKLYATEGNTDTRWLNALLGRIFLGIYQTKDIEHFIREKITTKISRIKRPSFLTHITVRRIDLGESAPFIANPRLKDLTVQGECVVEADVRYTGNSRIEISTTVKVDIGHFTREVPLVLAVVLKKLEGHVLLKIKPPPSDRLWVAFSTMPKLEMAIEPIVSSRQITWTVILKQIESRIREVFAESMVLPFWDDTPFFHTEHKKWRGGIWENDNAVRPPSDMEAAVAQCGNVDAVEVIEQSGRGHVPIKHMQSKDKDRDKETSQGISSVENGSQAQAQAPLLSPGLFSRRLTGKGFLSPKPSVTGTTTGADLKSPAASLSSRALRTGSFSSAPIPIVSTDTTNSDVFKPSTPPDVANAASRMANISSKIQQEHESPVSTPYGSPSRPSSINKASSIHSNISSKEVDMEDSHIVPSRADSTLTNATTGTTSSTESNANVTSPVSSKFSLRSHPTTSSLTRGFFSRKDDSQTSFDSMDSGNSFTTTGDTKRGVALAAVSNAALQARQWGLNALKRHDGKGHDGDGPQIDLSQPMGRGQPLPPPGMPLPMPDKKTPTAPIPPGKRHLAPPPPPLLGKDHRDTSHHKDYVPGLSAGGYDGGGSLKQSAVTINANGNGGSSGSSSSNTKDQKTARRPVPIPPLPKRRLVSNGVEGTLKETILVVAAPESSEPTTPRSTRETWDDEGETKNRLSSTGNLGLPSPSSAGLGIAVVHTPIIPPMLNIPVDTPRCIPDLPPRKSPTSHPRTSAIVPGESAVAKKINQEQQQKYGEEDYMGRNKTEADANDEFAGWIDGQEFEDMDVDAPQATHVDRGGSATTTTNARGREGASVGRPVSSGNGGGGAALGSVAMQAASKKAYATTSV